MRPLRIALWLGALTAFASTGSPARAGWDNVFQVCCHGCRQQASSSYYAPATSYYQAATSYYADACPPQQTCTTRYVTRYYTQNYTAYEPQTVTEKVTSYQTSYYLEPVTSYRVSCYYDPCTCSYRQCAQPVTSYRVRSQCCPVESWVSRCVMVPVTKQQTVAYLEPQTTCCQTTIGAPIPVPNGGAAGAAPAPAAPSSPPNVSEFRSPPVPAPGVSESRELTPNSSSRPFDPYAAPKSFAPQTDATPRLGAPAPPAPRLRPERIVSAPRYNVAGEVVRADESGESGARLLFRRVDRPEESETVKADAKGRFRATLASGTWEVLTQSPEGRLVSHTRIQVREDEPKQVRVKNR